MIKLPSLRVLIEPVANTGLWNMAVDEVLLQSAIEHDVATLRFYRWCEPTLSLGYFQKENELIDGHGLQSLPKVRRLTGGGALVHDHELTYSLALPASQRLISRPVELYLLVHRVYIAILAERGIPLRFRGSTVKAADEPFLCFARQDEHDLVIAGDSAGQLTSGGKVLGSAQRRRRGSILQHGGLLLRSSKWTPQLMGISDLHPNADLSGLDATLGQAIGQELAVVVEKMPLTTAEIESASRAVRSLSVGA